MALIRFEQASLTRTGATFPVLQALNFDISAGETLAVMGGCGSGKTTLACWMGGWVPHALLASIDGIACFDGLPLAGRITAQLAEHVQLVQSNPYAGLTGCAFSVAAEVAFGPENLGLPETEIRRRVAAALELCEATELASRRPATLSGGEAQRVAIAAALAMQPRLLLLDEAFSRLAPAAAKQLLARIESMTRNGMTLVLFEKQFDFVAPVADRVLLLNEGRQQTIGRPAEVFDQALGHVRSSDALRAAKRARGLGLWRDSVLPPLNAEAAPACFREAQHG